MSSFGASHLKFVSFQNSGTSTCPRIICELQSSLGNLSQLVDLDFSFNHFFTSIPPELCNLKNLLFELVPRHLHWSKTHSLCTLSFGRFVLGLNIISGSIPTILAILSKLTALDLSRNYINYYSGPSYHLWKIVKTTQVEPTSLEMKTYFPYEDIIAATEDLDLKYCIGSTGYGSVCKAQLPTTVLLDVFSVSPCLSSLLLRLQLFNALLVQLLSLDWKEKVYLDQMAESWDGSYDHGSQSDESYQFERLHVEPIYDAFVCPLTKQVMSDPVTLENGQTFEREAIEKWFKECRESGRKLVCPLTQKELRSTELNPSMALRNTIEEWTARNEAVQLDTARRSLNPGSPESDVLDSLKYIQYMCHKSQSNKHAVRNADLIPMVVEMLKSTSRRVRCKALETLQIVVEDDADNKAILAEGDNVRTIVKFLSHEQSIEREEAVSLLLELSKSEALCEKIGSVNGAILILVGMISSKSENLSTVEKADKTLGNLEKCENNVRQMAENGRLRPLLNQILEGPPETKLAMASYLGELVMNNDVKVLVARTVGSSLINIMRSGNMQSRETALKALNQISFHEASAKVLIEAGILPPLVKDLFTVGTNQLPMRLKEVAATILANVVNSGDDFDLIPVGPDHHSLVSEDMVHNLLHLISNTGPAIECKLLQVLVGLTSSSSTVLNVVAAIKSSGAINSLVQFIEAPQRDLRVASIKLLQKVSPHMGQELADALCGVVGQLGSLFKVVAENTGITEEQATAIGLLAELPERDLGLTRQMLDESSFPLIISRVVKIQQGEIRSARFMTPFFEGLVRVLSRVTFVLADEPDAIKLAREHNLAALFIQLLQSNGLDNVQMVSAMALENLAQESKNLTRLPELPPPNLCASIFPCFSKKPVITGSCRLHGGTCSLKETFCLLEGQAVEKLVALLDHTNEKVVEAALAAISTLLDDGVNIEQGVAVLCEAEGVRPILDVLLEKRTENLRRRAVWAAERLLRTDDIAYEVSGDPNVSTALVDAFQHADYRTRQIAERALKHVDKIPNFSGIYPNTGQTAF
uniref:RING-type E3 ubiquitin transferase n=1 Tax=Populus alba TaxID=43335 RepID=A0A4U5Q0V0_POPAL|nr:armadillo/beta-catenin repeat family protein [Populus alba]